MANEYNNNLDFFPPQNQNVSQGTVPLGEDGKEMQQQSAYQQPQAQSAYQQTQSQSGYQQPYQPGYQQPQQPGYQPQQPGYQQPQQPGYQQPQQPGYQQAYQPGYQQPYQPNYQPGYQQGYQQPYQPGYQQPYPQGYQQPYPQPGYPAPYPMEDDYAEPSNPIGTTGFIIGIVSFATSWIPGFNVLSLMASVAGGVCSGIGLSRWPKVKARLGLIFSIIATVLSVFFINLWEEM